MTKVQRPPRLVRLCSKGRSIYPNFVPVADGWGISFGVGSFDLVRGDYLSGAARKPPHGSTFLLASGTRFIMAL